MLNKREKRKLKELAERARSTFEIRDTMRATQDEATLEIQEMLSLFDKSIKGACNSTELSVPSFSLELQEQMEQLLNDILSGKSGSDQEFRNSANNENPNNTDGDGNIGELGPDPTDVPDWVKKLKKQIAKKCHPDAVARANVSALESFRRSEYFTQVDEAYRASNWNEILLVGVYLDLYPDQLPASNQKQRIARCYQEVNSQVNEIKKSIGYKWSENWTDYDLKWTILEFYLRQKGMAVPDKAEAIKKIVEYENSLG